VEADVTQGWQTYGRSTHDRRKKKAKSRRAANPSAATSAANAPAPAAGETQQQAAASRPAATTSNVTWRSSPAQRTAVATIRPDEYRYVYSDLKRIAVLATGILATLVILSFIIK
jgi:hypothetical protein